MRRPRVAWSALLALAVVLAGVLAGTLGANAWRQGVRAQADREFHRQATAVAGKFHDHLATIDQVLTTGEQAAVGGRTLSSAWQGHDLIRELLGVVAVGRLAQDQNGTIRPVDEFSAVASVDTVDLRFQTMLGPQLRQALAASAQTGRTTASPRYDFLWFSSRMEPTFFVARPMSVPGSQEAHEWIVVMVYGNWMLEDSLQAAGSSLRAELRDGGVMLAGDYLPIGAYASKPPPPIPANAKRVETPLAPYGRAWTLVVADADGVTAAHIGSQPTLLALGVSLLGLLSGLLVLVLGRGRVRALRMVDEATAELRDSQTQLRRSEERFRSIVQYASDAILLVDGEGRVVYQSESTKRVFGYEDDELLHKPVLDLAHPDEVAHTRAAFLRGKAEGLHTHVIRCRLRGSDGTWHPTETIVADLVDDPNVAAIVLTIRDITERQALEDQLRHQAFHDSLTGLANRALFADRVSHALAQRRMREGGVAVLLCDLDDFKTVNDSLGHAAGDALLTEVAQRLAGCVRGGDTVARLGGDEFAVLLEAPAGEQQAQDVAERILAALKPPVRLVEREVVIGSSVGIAVEPVEGIDAEALLRNADVAMYLAKAEGKGRMALFRPAMHAEVLARLAMRADLEGAVDRDEFVLHYQPVFDLASGRLSGVEALLRWQHPEHGLVMPGEFIPLAEETGHIVEIGRQTLLRACRQIVAWQQAYPQQPPLRLSVNLSVRQLADQQLADDVAAVLAETGLDPSCLTLEITESMLIRDLELVLDQLERLKALGVSLAIDDFGTGYSSLGYLQHLPVDTVKIDRSFVHALGEPGGDPALVRAVVDLASSLGLDTVAEGIEGDRQLDLLRALACRHGQGYLFARPLDPVDVQVLLAAVAPLREDAAAAS